MVPYFEYTQVDRDFYSRYIRPRLPEGVFDVHVHLNLPEHIAMVPEERWLSDWALECAHLLTCDEAYDYAKKLFPQTRYSIAGFPWPIREADMGENNRYLERMHKEGKISPFMTVKPEWDPETVERVLLEGNFVGFKPYPDMVSGVKGADISINTFFPPHQWEILDRNKKAVMLHLPRKGRLADDRNVRELKQLRQRYPDVTLIIAHFGRSFCPYYLREGLRKLSDFDGFYFDTSAVINPEVYDIALSHISTDRILYGSDMPVTLWHGRRTWSERDYRNLCREDFTWNKEHEPPEIEKGYTLFLYEEIRVILDAIERHNLSIEQKEAIFSYNAKRALKIRQ